MLAVTRGYGAGARIGAVVCRGFFTGYPVITAISTLVPSGAYTVDGFHFGASAGTLVVGGQAQTVDSWSDLQLTGVSFTQGDLKYFASHNAVVTDASAQASANFTTPITLPGDHTAVDLLSIETESDYRITAVADLAIGDQLEARNVAGGDIADITLNDDATFNVNSGVLSFEVRAWSAADSTWGAYATQTVSITGVGLGQSMTSYIGHGIRLGL